MNVTTNAPTDPRALKFEQLKVATLSVVVGIGVVTAYAIGGPVAALASGIMGPVSLLPVAIPALINTFRADKERQL
jgi:ABC-type transport system involved in cytochrome c biogenesis permease component